MIQSVFMPPPMSWRRKRSAKTVIRSQNQMTQAKKIEHRPEDVEERVVRCEHSRLLFRGNGESIAASVERMDRERDGESKRRHDADELAAVLVRLGHHRVGEHRQDRARGERENEGDDVRRGALEQAVARK